jgi:hypothetical protein
MKLGRVSMAKTRWMKLSKRKKTIVPGPCSHPRSPCHLCGSQAALRILLTTFSHADDLSAPKITIGWISRVAFVFLLSSHDSRPRLVIFKFSMFSTVHFFLISCFQVICRFASTRSHLSYKICLSASPNNVSQPQLKITIIVDSNCLSHYT